MPLHLENKPTENFDHWILEQSLLLFVQVALCVSIITTHFNEIFWENKSFQFWK